MASLASAAVNATPCPWTSIQPTPHRFKRRKTLRLARRPLRIALPAFGDGGDDVRECARVACVDLFGRRMGVAQRPAEGDINRTVRDERGTVVTAPGHSVLHRNVIGTSELDDAFEQIARDDIRAVHGADDEAFAEFGARITLRFVSESELTKVRWC